MPAIEIRETPPDELLRQAQELLVANWLEMESARFPDAPKPKTEVYEAMSEEGSLIGLGAYDEDKLIGYAVFALIEHLHYEGSYAHCEVIYVSPEYRRQGVGADLFDASRQFAKVKGARWLAWSAKPESAFAKVLQRYVGKPEEMLFVEEV